MSAVIRLVFLAYFGNITPRADMLVYYVHGFGLAKGNEYVNFEIPNDGTYIFNEASPTAYRPVGYPAFIAAVMILSNSENIVNIQLIQITLSCINILLVYLISLRLTRQTAVPLVAAFLVAIHPNQIAYSIVLQTETLSLFLLLLSTLSFVEARNRPIKSLLVGVIIGLAVYVKPQLILIPIVYFVVDVFISWKIRYSHVLSLILCFAAVILVQTPWLVRNHQKFGQVIFVSTNGGINLLIGNNPFATGQYHYGPEIINLFTEVGLNEAELDKRAQNLAISYIIDNPIKSLQIIPTKIYHTFRDGYDGIGWVSIGLDGEPKNGVLNRLYTIWSQTYWRILLISFLCTIIIHLRNISRRKINWHLPVLCLGMIAFQTAIVIAYFGGSRFRYLIDPWIIMYVSVFATWIIKLTKVSKMSWLGIKSHENPKQAKGHIPNICRDVV